MLTIRVFALRFCLSPIVAALAIGSFAPASHAADRSYEAAGDVAQTAKSLAAKRLQLRMKALGGDLAAKYKLAISYFDPFDILRRADGSIVDDTPDDVLESDLRQARDLFAQLSDRDPMAATALAVMLETGRGGPADAARARQLYETAQTDRALWHLGAMREHGLGGPVDLEGSREAYARAGDLGVIEALYAQARMTRIGLGGPRDTAEARRLLMRVVAYCHAAGAEDLAKMAEKGEGGARDVAMAAEYYVHSAQCRNDYFDEVRLMIDPMAIDAEVRVAIQRLLAEHFGYRGPIDGSLDRPDIHEILDSLSDQRPDGESMPGWS